MNRKVPLPSSSRWLAGALVVMAAALLAPALASANTVSITSQSEGAITISNGDFVAAGYELMIPGNHPDTHVTIANAVVTISGSCSNGGSDTLTIPLTAGPYDIPLNSGNEVPSGPAGEDDPISYQGSATANVCGGVGKLDGSHGAVFTADIQSDQTAAQLHIQFHYRDPNAKGMGNVNCQTAPLQAASVCGASWSSTDSINPDPYLPGFTIVKEQMIDGVGSFTTSQLTGQVGQKVDYEVIVSNTGNTPLTFSALTDAHCDSGTLTGGPGATPIAAGGSATFSCTHTLTAADQTAGSYSNNATVTGTPPANEGTPTTTTSNTVVVVVPTAPAPAFTIVKEQEIVGSGSFTTAQLTGAVGQTVDYELIVTNTGNTSLTFGSLTDTNCDAGTIAGGPGGNTVAAGASTTFTCSHMLTAADQAAGQYTNNGMITGTPPGGSAITHASNTVVVIVPPSPAPSFTVLKEQMIVGSGSFTTSTLTGAVGQTVDYELIVTNTGNTSLTFSALSDPHCDAGTLSGGPGGNPLASGSSTTFTCSHVITAADQAAGSYTNTGTITGTPPPGQGTPTTTPSNTVVVNVPPAPAPSFSIVKEQMISGVGAFTTSTLTGSVGQTVNYEIIVTNTGNTPLTFSALTDPRCDSGTLSGGPGGNPVAAGGSTTFTCSHVLAAADQAAGSYTNVGTITGTPPGGPPTTTPSNPVVVNIPPTPAPSYSILKEQQIAGSGSFTTSTLTGSVGQTVLYEVIVTNTGNTPLTFSELTDQHCDSGTLAGGPGGNPVAAGTSTTFFCAHVLTAADQVAGSYTNTGTITGTPPAGEGPPVTTPSNTVVVNVPPTPVP